MAKLVFALLLAVVFAFDNKEFKKCSDISFCRKHREFAEQGKRTSMLVKPESVQLSNNVVTGVIVNTVELAEFTFELAFLAQPHNTLHLKINEAQADSKRFETPFVIQEGVTIAEASATQTMEEITLSSGHSKLVLTYSPFKLEVFRGSELVLIANHRGLFNFEHYRPRVDDDPQEHWEERFKNHVETKRRGPSSVSMDFTFVGAQHVYGIPERATSLALKPTRGENTYAEPYRMYNLDVFEYNLDSPFGLYGTVPLMLGHTQRGTSAVFVLNSSEMYVDVSPTTAEETGSTSSHWYAESGLLDIYIFLGPSPADILDEYTFLTGRPHLPPQFSIAYHQCRWNYKDEDDVDHVDDKFDEHDIPYDVLWLDIEHTDGKRYFTWDSKLFPTPQRMQDDLASKGRSMVTIVDPHIKRDSDYPLHAKAVRENLYVKTKEGTDFEGHCWPGASSYLDFYNPKAREAYALEYERYTGATKNLHTWNDMNEPSVFNGPEMTLPKDTLHGDVEHRELHNIYGMLHHMSSFDGLIKRLQGLRPFILTRSFFSGSQRYAGVWTGDNMAKWDHLEAAQPMLLALSISGVPFVGADVGGFFGNPEPELLVRWYQVGAYHPFFRAHAHIDTKRREPWLAGEPHTSRIREAIRSRYHLLPYWYTTAFKSNQTGAPMMRPLFFEFPTDENVFANDRQFMVGDAVMVAPVTASGVSSLSVYLPGNQFWYDLLTGQQYTTVGQVTVDAPIDKIPVFQRGGTIIPKRERNRRSSTLMERDPITLVVALNPQEQAAGELFLDDGDSFDFLSGQYIHRSFEFKNGVLTSTAKHSGTFPFSTDITFERVVIRGVKQAPTKVTKEESGLVIELTFTYDPQLHQLTIRKPLTSLAKDWTIVIA